MKPEKENVLINRKRMKEIKVQKKNKRIRMGNPKSPKN